eukprot:g10037.t1
MSLSEPISVFDPTVTVPGWPISLFDPTSTGAAPGNTKGSNAAAAPPAADTAGISEEDFELLTEYELLGSSLGHRIPNLYVLPDFKSLRTWHGCLFVHRGLYRGLIARFTVTIPTASERVRLEGGDYRSASASTTPFYPHSLHGVEVKFLTRFPHPLVCPRSGRLDLEGVLEEEQNVTMSGREQANGLYLFAGGEARSQKEIAPGEAQAHGHKNLILLLQYAKSIFLRRDRILLLGGGGVRSATATSTSTTTRPTTSVLNPDFLALLRTSASTSSANAAASSASVAAARKCRSEIAEAVAASRAHLFEVNASSIQFRNPLSTEAEAGPPKDVFRQLERDAPDLRLREKQHISVECFLERYGAGGTR